MLINFIILFYNYRKHKFVSTKFIVTNEINRYITRLPIDFVYFHNL